MGPNLKVTSEGLVVQTGFPYKRCLHDLKWNEGWCIRVIRLAVMTPKSQWLSTKKRVYFSFILQSDAGLGNGVGSSVHSFIQGSQALSIMWRSCLQHVASKIITEWEEGMRAAWEIVWVQPRNGTHCFCFDSIAQNSLSWHQFNCREAEKCSKFLFSRSCARRRMLMVNTGGLCHRQGEWLSLLGMGGWAVVSVLGWDGSALSESTLERKLMWGEEHAWCIPVCFAAS